MSILIVGSEGSMGTRYKAIMRFLNKPFQCADIYDTTAQIGRMAERSEGVIISTPTNTHIPLIRALSCLKIPLLCEKPISKDIGAVRDLVAECKDENIPLTMMLQYEQLLDKDNKLDGPSYYNYFRHGGDGIIWDCIQIIGLAKTPPTILNTSPVWNCKINGQRLSLSHMDQAYVSFIENWLDGRWPDLDRILEMHEKTHRFEAELNGKN